MPGGHCPLHIFVLEATELIPHKVAASNMQLIKDPIQYSIYNM